MDPLNVSDDQKDSLLKLIDSYKNEKPKFMVEHFTAMIAFEAVSFLRKDLAAAREEIAKLKEAKQD